MMTPDSIANKRFDKAMGGYRQDEVDAFLEQIAAQIKAMQVEKEDLERKVEVLANKIEEYRADEDSLRSALVGAQKLGDSVIRDSKAKADAILLDAKAEAAKIIETAQRNVEIEQTALETMKKEVTKFKSRMLTLYKQHLDLITALPEFADEMIANENAALEASVTAKEQPVAPAVQHVEEVIPEVVPVQETPAASDADTIVLDFSGMVDAAEPAKQEKPAMSFSEIPTPSSESGNSKFGQLKFGEGFDVERDEGKKGMFSRKKHR